jgi:acyl-coenzyme A thioesterase 13
MENRNEKIKSILSSQVGQVVTNSPSPFMLWLAPIVREVGEGTLTFDYLVRAEMTNPMGTLHGGVTAAIMDDLIGATIITLGKPHFYTTINNVIDYFSGAVAGETITGKTNVVKTGRQILNVQFELWNLKKERLLARGYSNALRTEILMSETGQKSQLL